ncbi:hypothetical protein [Halomicrobium salinisoli]|uniref:biosurfactant protein 1 n=1 Tax=Halomicrobium salinisoli TaxID=2878391 RepID=UPI001CF04988|nr:hypothetical protein [Halomicrobium salinisoli]
MSDYYSDFEELRPTGEASHIPDEQFSEGCNGDPQWQRMASTGGYPDESTDADRECQSCGASIPAGQTKCRFCLSNHLDTEAANTDDTTDATLLGVVHMVVESTNYYGAVAKGEAAANFLASNDAEPAVEDYTLIYDLDETPAPQLADRWPSLPAAVQLGSTEGEQLLAAARDRAGWHGQAVVGNQQQAPTRLYDHRGNGIRDQTRLTEIVDDADDEMWLIPAIALTAIADERNSEGRSSLIPTTTRLDCQDCGRATDHQFEARESIPDETWTRQPIWECQVCGTHRYGPVPE